MEKLNTQVTRKKIINTGSDLQRNENIWRIVSVDDDDDDELVAEDELAWLPFEPVFVIAGNGIFLFNTGRFFFLAHSLTL
jgi:hypothetical protein